MEQILEKERHFRPSIVIEHPLMLELAYVRRKVKKLKTSVVATARSDTKQTEDKPVTMPDLAKWLGQILAWLSEKKQQNSVGK